ncbi:MAG: DNRLRE domain-containing protein [Syntrophobacterales bacterium]|nr:MAG: DNRLRE domain-containing protein [Syntrophobacterales bacterium]
MRRISMNDKTKNVTKLCGFLFLAAIVVGLAVQPLSAQVIIPEGSTINSAVFNVYVYEPNGREVNLHRITAEWAETVVTYANFLNSYAASSEGGFTADAVGWKQVNITSLVQAWAAGTYPNYGIAMVEPIEAGINTYAYYHSSEYTVDPTLRPNLVIGYTPPGGSLTYVTIQRPGIPAEQVVDAGLNSLLAYADVNYGTEINLWTRYFEGQKKYSLARFIFSITPLTDCPGTGTPGYWINHPEAWPVDEIMIGGIFYSKAEAIELMMLPVTRDKTLTMFPALVSAKLNAATGCAKVCPGGVDIPAVIAEADAWMSLYPVLSGVFAGGPSSPWRTGEPLYFLLDQYNNGLLCVPHRD